MRFLTALLVLTVLPLPQALADIVWTGATGTDLFEEGNWDLSGSTVTATNPNVTIDDNVVILAPNPGLSLPEVAGQVRFQVGDGFVMSLENGSLTSVGNDGIGGVPGTATGFSLQLKNNALLDVFFITNQVQLDIDGSSQANLRGGATPINGSFVNLTAGALLTFPDETPADFTAEHLGKISVDGIPAVLGQNLDVVSDGATGSIVTVITNLVGTSYCGPAVPNTTGLSAYLEASGSDLVADNDLRLTARDLPQDQFAMFLNSQSAGFIPNPGGSQGNLCLIGALGRYNPAAGYPLQTSGSSGSLSLLLDLTTTPTPSGPITILAGQTWHFQCWYRDWIPGMGATSNFTDGVSVSFP